MQKAVRDLRAGDKVLFNGRSREIKNIITKLGQDGTPPMLISGPFKSAMAMEVEFEDGEKNIAHPSQVATLIC